MGPEQQPAQPSVQDPFLGDRTIQIVLWDDTVEVVNAGCAVQDTNGSLHLYAGEVTTPNDVEVATYAADTWRSWYTEADEETLSRALAARHPWRILRGAVGRFLIARLGYPL